MTYAAPLSSLAVELIGLYQRWVSPVKGFSCALRTLRRQRQSCSQFGRRVIERFGLLPGVRLIRRRFDQCRRASLILDYEAARRRKDDQARREAWCAGADLTPGCDAGGMACEAASLAPDVCDLAGACDAGCCDLAL